MPKNLRIRKLTARIEIVATPKQKKRLERICREDHCSHSDFLRECIDNTYIERHPPKDKPPIEEISREDEERDKRTEYYASR